MKQLTKFFLIPLIYCLTQTGNAQSDLSILGGFQIRPETSFVKVGQSQLLKVRNCVLNQTKDDHGTPLLGFMYECDPGDLFPLLPPTSKWSVNGIVGGNEKIGTIKAKDNGSALYTAPKHKQGNEIIQVSAELQTEGKGKELVVANIIILDDARIYYGMVMIQGEGDGVSFNAFGFITFKETGKNTDSFNSITGSLNVYYAVDDCTAFQGKLPLAGELYLYETEEDRSFAGGTHHGISFFADSFEINCHGVNIPQGLLAVMAPCDGGAYGKSIEEGKILVGDGNCEGINIKWKLTKQ
ncbi:hypothetical protein [Yeosuana sp.]|uniref:hypothetical protein n=1 Tax=Yeosuana sp. TaxID=2529388 RepID=UPI004054BE32|tara:strand:- start:417 stop:1307 length:891 start_codon:yes stop_codon:yes gene_type:complete